MLATIGVTRGLGDHDLKVHDSNIYIKPFLSCCPEVRASQWKNYKIMITSTMESVVFFQVLNLLYVCPSIYLSIYPCTLFVITQLKSINPSNYLILCIIYPYVHYPSIGPSIHPSIYLLLSVLIITMTPHHQPQSINIHPSVLFPLFICPFIC